MINVFQHNSLNILIFHYDQNDEIYMMQVWWHYDYNILYFTLWLQVAFTHHYRVYYRWRHRNQFVRLLHDSPEKAPSETSMAIVDENNNNNILRSGLSDILPASASSPATVNSHFICRLCSRHVPFQTSPVWFYLNALLHLCPVQSTADILIYVNECSVIFWQ